MKSFRKSTKWKANLGRSAIIAEKISLKSIMNRYCNDFRNRSNREGTCFASKYKEKNCFSKNASNYPCEFHSENAKISKQN